MSAPSPPESQTPTEEVSERLSQAGTGLAMAARAVGLEDHRRMLAGVNRRTEEGHRAMAQAAGMEAALSPTDESGSAMGDIFVTGDIYGSDAKAPWRGDSGQAAAQPQPAAKLPGWMKTAGVILGSLAAGGVGATAVSALWPDGEAAPQPAAAELNPGGMTIEVVEQPKQ